MKPNAVLSRGSGRSYAKIAGAMVGVAALIAGFFATREVSPTWPRVNAQIQNHFPSVPQIETAELQRRLDAGSPIVLIDVRTAPEFAVSHLAHSRRVDPFHDPDAAISHLPKDTPIVAYCSVGYRSSDYVKRLRSLGFTQAANLKGSIFAWVNEGRPLVNDAGPVRKVHPFDEHWGKLLLPSHRAHQ